MQDELEWPNKNIISDFRIKNLRFQLIFMGPNIATIRSVYVEYHRHNIPCCKA